MRRVLQTVWRNWVDEAKIFPPPLVSSSDSDHDAADQPLDPETDSSDESEDDVLRLLQPTQPHLLPQNYLGPLPPRTQPLPSRRASTNASKKKRIWQSYSPALQIILDVGWERSVERWEEVGGAAFSL